MSKHFGMINAKFIAKVTATARGKFVMKLEKTLNFWVEDMNRKRVPFFITFYYHFT